jgi:hypothetical protein
MWGKASLRASDPEVSYLSGVLYVPFSDGRTWGIYDRSGQLVPEATDYHGPAGTIEKQLTTIDLQDFGNAEQAPEGLYQYGGFLNPHYGHFIINSLSRLWLHGESEAHSTKILWHGPGSPEAWFKIPFIKAIFQSLGLYENKFVVLEKPTVIPRLLIPHPSFQEQHYVHRAFGKVCQSVGKNIVQASMITKGALEKNSRPVYLSKAALTSGVGRISNEPLIVEILRNAGIDIVFPEQVSFSDQIRLFAERSNICGIAGSAMHTQAFWPAAGSVSILNATDGPNSNFHLIDLAANLITEYFYAPGAKVLSGEDQRFLTSIEMAEPELIAADLLKIFDLQEKK